MEETEDALELRMQLARYYVGVGRFDEAREQLGLLADRPGGWGAASTQLAALDYAEGNESAAPLVPIICETTSVVRLV